MKKVKHPHRKALIRQKKHKLRPVPHRLCRYYVACDDCLAMHRKHSYVCCLVWCGGD